MNDEIQMGFVLTLAGKEAIEATMGLNGSGQGELLDVLSKTPLARSEYKSYFVGKYDRVDTAYLSRFDGTDYCQWHGRQRDGCFHPMGRILKIIEIAEIDDALTASPEASQEKINE